MIDDFKKVIRKLDASKSCGLDKIPANISKDCNEIIPPYLTYIYICSTAIFPDDWKMARVAPTFKAGNKEDCDNYRPISILSTVAKIFEKLICGQRNKYLVNQNVLSKHHPGFREGHLTSPSLLSTTNSWLLNIVSGMIKEYCSKERIFEVPCIKYKPLSDQFYNSLCKKTQNKQHFFLH